MTDEDIKRNEDRKNVAWYRNRTFTQLELDLFDKEVEDPINEDEEAEIEEQAGELYNPVFVYNKNTKKCDYYGVVYKQDNSGAIIIDIRNTNATAIRKLSEKLQYFMEKEQEEGK